MYNTKIKINNFHKKHKFIILFKTYFKQHLEESVLPPPDLLNQMACQHRTFSQLSSGLSLWSICQVHTAIHKKQIGICGI